MTDRRRETWSFTKLIIWTSQLIKDLAKSPTITGGAGVPSAAEPNGSFYLRTNGTTYNRTGAAWVASAPPQMVEVADPGDAAAIPVTASADIQMTTGAGGETGTLADPTAVGLTLHLRLTVDGGGDRVITAASGVNAAGNTTLTFADAGDSLVLMSTRDGAATYNWRVVANDGVALA